MEKAKNFFSKAFGWEFTDYAPTYSGIKSEAGEMGGLSQVENVQPGKSPLVVLYSNQLDESLASVKEAGGTITKEIFEFPGGKRFEFSDLDGNPMAVWTHL